MLDRLSVSVSLATILAVFAKLVSMFKFNEDFFKRDTAFPHDTTVLIIATFLIFFRGKMMHDDHQYFTDIDSGLYRDKNKWFNKFALFLGYNSWLLWAPAIYFLGSWPLFGMCMLASIFI